MDRIIRWEMDGSCEGQTVEQFLRAHGCSHHIVTHLKRTEDGIWRNGHRAYTNEKLTYGDVLRIHIAEPQSSPNIVPVPLPLDIVYEDEDLLVVNKPCDMPIHPSVNNYENTLANGLMYYFSSRGLPFVYRCINRLDRDTSGLLIVAKHMLSAAILSGMSAGRQIHREYLAVVEGALPPSGTIDAPIARMPGSALMRCVDFANGERAVTHYTCETRFAPDTQAVSAARKAGDADTPSSSVPQSAGDADTRSSAMPQSADAPPVLSLARIRLETGRTHQIRVHMKHIGHPLIGDFLYNPQQRQLISRQALHSARLSFIHPITGKELSFSCELPPDIQRIFSGKPTFF